MAKRKAAGGTRKVARKSSRAASRTSGRTAASKSGQSARKASRAGAKSTRSSRAGTRAAKTAAPRGGTKAAARKTTARKTAKRAKTTKGTTRKAAAPPKGTTRKTAAAVKPAKQTKQTKQTKSARKRPAATPRSAPPARARGESATPPRKAASLDRERRTVAEEDEEVVPTPPSSLDLDRSASAVRTGRRGMQQRFAEHTETSPAMTGGDVDADWESAYSVGDEAPGGDNPTPDQDIVDDIGRAVGVEYQDNEELKSEEKIAKRDAHRWELDPASAEDWDDRD
jgi:uncharacterized protein DUF6335